MGRTGEQEQTEPPSQLDHDALEIADAMCQAGLSAVSYSSVSDLRVIGFNAQGGLGATRQFELGEAVQDHRRQLERIASISTIANLPIARTVADVWAAQAIDRTALLLMCEGADFAEDDLSLVAEAHELGVRCITIVHYRQNVFGDLQTEPSRHNGLSAKGVELVTQMNRLGIIVDMAHASFETTCAAVEASTDPVMISHTHLRHSTDDHPRLVSLEHARVVASAGGLIGAWPSGVRSASFDDFVDEVARLADAVGVDHVGIGTDMDANYRPVMTRYQEFHDLADALAKRGMTHNEIDRVLGLNALELFQRVCG